MTRALVYASELILFTLASVLTLLSILLPSWISYHDSGPPSGHPLTYHLGLHSRCSTSSCTPFPRPSDCHGPDRTFCSIWRSVGFLMSLAVVLEAATIVCFMTILMGGKAKREQGWWVVTGMMGVTAILQATAVGLVGGVFIKDERFFEGWELGGAGFWRGDVWWGWCCWRGVGGESVVAGKRRGVCDFAVEEGDW
ncbi:Similar to hypothetical protein [Tuber melanosporum Mel28]; acc. no. XP_002836639 [Pyronema omphalodes CBS 100304]|uniref:Uncharacterized protein n=1 Tax=Pyronema omphalodes (strain CBS 100304) TaxID=1076935 RepID=U4L5B3_PYROM|nr:Similar to hypothetical protein [Tuber melanosporum Mel28]; acc. no. XP_002836639 [Pyronema omphalodes CBS 100304]